MTSSQSSRLELFPTYTQAHQQALELEVSVLEALLRRNRCSHQRCLYFKRLQMAVRSLHRNVLLSVWEDLQALQQQLETQRRVLRQKRKRREVFWETKPTNDDDDSEQQLALYDEFSRLEQTITVHLQETKRRLEYAAEALFREIARGFFLPLCTVAVAAVARVRTLLSMLAQDAQTMALVQLQSLLQETYGGDKNRTETKPSAVEATSTPTSLSSADRARRTRDESLRRTLHSLGIPLPKNKKQSLLVTTNPELPSKASSRQEEDRVHPNRDDVDVGDSVHELTAAEPLQHTSTPSSEPASATHSAIESSMTHTDPMDKNLTFLLDIKAQKKKEKEAKRAAKRSNPTDRSDKKKKKTSKSKKGGDFFDELFG